MTKKVVSPGELAQRCCAFAKRQEWRRASVLWFRLGERHDVTRLVMLMEQEQKPPEAQAEFEARKEVALDFGVACCAMLGHPKAVGAKRALLISAVRDIVFSGIAIPKGVDIFYRYAVGVDTPEWPPREVFQIVRSRRG